MSRPSSYTVSYQLQSMCYLHDDDDDDDGDDDDDDDDSNDSNDSSVTLC